eukprot:NODE_504_length_782_cov_317.967939_g495_i0.p1 GENE.NODE_504_length_782_cov_317.967939_g495_i0~~NODE_504_length_782_cov_317.967939_g495_i0.p1  ORF type:complete len:212 (-),score=49.12 NODE_504_length_782_cov_317.967939_g495_i0:36-671(-)
MGLPVLQHDGSKSASFISHLTTNHNWFTFALFVFVFQRFMFTQLEEDEEISSFELLPTLPTSCGFTFSLSIECERSVQLPFQFTDVTTGAVMCVVRGANGDDSGVCFVMGGFIVTYCCSTTACSIANEGEILAQSSFEAQQQQRNQEEQHKWFWISWKEGCISLGFNGATCLKYKSTNPFSIPTVLARIPNGKVRARYLHVHPSPSPLKTD